MLIKKLKFIKLFNRIKLAEKNLLTIFCVCIFFYVLFLAIILLTVEMHVDKEFEGVIDFFKVTEVRKYYITRPNGRDDGGVVHVMFAMFSTNINEMLCYAVASAYFTNIPIVVVGYKTPNYSHIDRHYRWMEAANAAKLEEHDIMMKLDSDIMFTGLDYLPFIDKFIKLSPANLNELDAKAIRTGQMMAPSTYSAEKNCYAPESLSKIHKECHEKYKEVQELNAKYILTLENNTSKPYFYHNDNPLQHLNSGTSIHRVWAMRKVFTAFYKFMANNKPLENKEWNCDQSVFAKLYLELRVWEINQDYFRKRTDELRIMHNEYGLYAGLMGLDFASEISSLIPPDLEEDFWLSTEFWQVNSLKIANKQKLFSKFSYEYLKKLYNLTNVTKVFMERKLTRSYSNVHSVTIAPPLLSVVSKHTNSKSKPEERVFPWLLHFAGLHKEKRWPIAVNYMQWYIPMVFDKEEYERGKEYVMSMPMELWTDTNNKLRLRYGDVCERHPFNIQRQRL